MAIELPDTRSESDDVLDALRLRAVRARQLGYAIADIAAIPGVREETVSRWCSRYSLAVPEFPIMILVEPG
jgi:Putative ATPase subunit of terminase (gpP-like)